LVNAEKKNMIAVLRKNSVFYQEVKTVILCNWMFNRFYNRKNRFIGEKNECPKGNKKKLAATSSVRCKKI
jgi:hypothetical protein